MVPRETRLPRKLSERAGIRTSTLFQELVLEASLARAIWLSNSNDSEEIFNVVGERGFEPPRYYYHMALNHARLPVPPLAPKMVRGFTTAGTFESEPRPRRGAG